MTTGNVGDTSTVEGCPNVDILFVIDSSGSMADQQDALIASFDGFVTAIKTQLGSAMSYHVGVATSSDYYNNSSGCAEIGSLITKTGGPSSSNATCAPFSSGKNYMDQSEPDLASKFACAAKVGTSGSDDEMMMKSLMNAVDPARNAPGQCNDGFSRQDSLLVVVLISDEDDVPEPYMCSPTDFNNPCMTTGSGGDKYMWHDAVVAAKGGIEQNVVVLSLIGLTGTNSCGAVAASKLIGFTNLWGDNGFKGDVCSSSYDQFFVDALPVVSAACQNYLPPG